MYCKYYVECIPQKPSSPSTVRSICLQKGLGSLYYFFRFADFSILHLTYWHGTHPAILNVQDGFASDRVSWRDMCSQNARCNDAYTHNDDLRWIFCFVDF